MVGLPFPNSGADTREPSWDNGTPFSGSGDIPIDPALSEVPLDPALLAENGVSAKEEVCGILIAGCESFARGTRCASGETRRVAVLSMHLAYEPQVSSSLALDTLSTCALPSLSPLGRATVPSRPTGRSLCPATPCVRAG